MSCNLQRRWRLHFGSHSAFHKSSQSARDSHGFFLFSVACFENSTGRLGRYVVVPCVLPTDCASQETKVQPERERERVCDGRK